jgi:hypothetical protein
MSIRRYSFWISALIVEFLSKIVKRALSVRPLVQEAPEWLIPGRAGSIVTLLCQKERYYSASQLLTHRVVSLTGGQEKDFNGFRRTHS